MRNSLDAQAIAPVPPTEEFSSPPSTEALPKVLNAVASARKPFVEPTVSAATDVLEVTQNFAQVMGSGVLP